MINFPLPILGFAAWSGTGKTTLLSQIIPLLKAKGLRIALINMLITALILTTPEKTAISYAKPARMKS